MLVNGKGSNIMDGRADRRWVHGVYYTTLLRDEGGEWMV